MGDEKNSIDKMDESDRAAMDALFSEDAFRMIEDMLDKETNQE